MYDGNQIVMRFAADASGTLGASNLKDRYLWGPAVDQLLADEQVTSLGSAGTVSWAFTDQENTVRNVAQYNAGSNTTSVVDHNTYDTFGQKLFQSAAAADILFGYTGRPSDTLTGLQNNGERWYNPGIGRWMSQDPIGFAGGDSNLTRYVGNSPTNFTDPTGLADTGIGIGRGYEKGSPIFSVWPFHNFIVIDGVGYGRVARNEGDYFGPGKICGVELSNYPQVDPSTLPNGKFYSVVTPYDPGPGYDPDKFKQALLDYVKQNQASPGDFNILFRNCDDFVNNALVYARGKSAIPPPGGGSWVPIGNPYPPPKGPPNPWIGWNPT